jgi:DNA-binding NarL/FixJ family response regulator
VSDTTARGRTHSVGIVLVAPPGILRDALARSLALLSERTDVTGVVSLDEVRRLSGRPVPALTLAVEPEPAALESLLEAMPDLRCVVLSGDESVAYVEAVLQAGAAGVVPVSTPEQILMEALRLVLAGGMYVPPTLLRRTAPPVPVARAEPVPAPTTDPQSVRLTQRQLEVLACMASGDSNKIIGRKLGIAEKTVKIHVAAICAAFGVSNRTQAAIAALRMADVRKRVADMARSGEAALGWLLPFAVRRSCREGDVVFRKGDSSDEMYYVGRGSVRLEEIGKDLHAGEMFGEIGLFLPDHVRTLTARCLTDVELYSISEESVMQLYFQNPQFAFQILRLVAQRLAEDLRRAQGR